MSAAAQRGQGLATSASKVPSVMVCGEALTLKQSLPKLAMPASFSTSRFASESPSLLHLSVNSAALSSAEDVMPQSLRN